MLKIIVESLNPQEPAVQWVKNMLDFKRVEYRVRFGKGVKGSEVVYISTFEKRDPFAGKSVSG